MNKPSLLLALTPEGTFKCLKIDTDAGVIEQEYKNEITNPSGLWVELFYLRKPSAWSRKHPIGEYKPKTIKNKKD
jgi:hypothetical protein